MKVLHAAETIQGGVATVMRLLLQGQLARDIDATALIPSGHIDELTGIPEDHIRTFDRSSRGILPLLHFVIAFIRTVWRMEPNVVHLHSTFAGAVGRVALLLLRPFRKPRVVYCPHCFAFLMDQTASKRRIYAFIERALYPLTDAIICVSEFERQEAIKAGLPKHKLKLVYNGVPVDTFKPKTEEEQPTDNNRPIRALFAGRLDEQKGFDILLEAMRQIPAGTVHLDVAGSRANATTHTNMDAENITYHGWVNQAELAQLYTRADVMVMPSRWEGFPMSLLEAMAHGLPVIASDNCSFPEVIETGVNSVLFAPGDADALSNNLIQYQTNEWKAMGQKANKTVINEFTTVQMIKYTLKVYA